MKVLKYSLGILLVLLECSEMEIKWVKKLDVAGAGNYCINDLFAYDGVYATGVYWETKEHPACFTAHYNEHGDLQWSNIYRQHNVVETEGVAILPFRQEIIESKPDVYLLMHATDVNQHKRVLLVKFDSLGTIVCEKVVEQSPGEIESALLLDAQNNICVVGWKKNSRDSTVIFVSKYRPSGELIWLREYYNPSYNFGNLQFDMRNGEHCVISGIEETNSDFFFIRCDDLGNFSSPIMHKTPQREDMLTDLLVTRTGMVYLTGTRFTDETGYDYLTLAYDNDNTVIWSQRFDGHAHLDDEAQALAIDDSFNLYVTGSSEIQKGITHIVTIKYDTTGEQVWTKSFEARDDVVTPYFLQPTFIGAERGDFANTFSIIGCIGGDVLIVVYNTNGHERWTERHAENDVDRPTACSGHYIAVETTSAEGIDACIMRYGHAEQFGIIRWD
jgi:hypothetical protein